MDKRYLLTIVHATIAVAVAGCAGGSAVVAPEVPQALRPPADQSVFIDALASGVQIYECASKPGDASAFEWNFRAPEAALLDRAGRPLGTHYAGPSWESIDGSIVVGDVKARDPGPDKSAIPWLLLTAKSTTGSGIFTQTKSIQRVKTTGGINPTKPCSAQNAGEVARVPYTATYYFYRAP